MSDRTAREVMVDDFEGICMTREVAENIVDGILAALEREGFAVVPVEPTEARLSAGANVFDINWDVGGPEAQSMCLDIWQAMLADGQEAKDVG